MGLFRHFLTLDYQSDVDSVHPIKDVFTNRHISPSFFTLSISRGGDGINSDLVGKV